MLALLLSRLTAEEERRLKASVSRSEALLRFCDEAFKHRHSTADWILSYGRDDDRPLSREGTRKLCERLLSHVFQVLAGSNEIHERARDEMDAAHASECVKCSVFIIQSLINRGVPVRWLLNLLDKRAELCSSFGLVEDMVSVHSQRWLMIQQLTSPGSPAEPELVYRDLLKATENLRFLIESEQFLFNHLEGSCNCVLFGKEMVAELERRTTDIALFNHRNRFVFLTFVQLILQSRIFFAKGDSVTGTRLVGEILAMADEYSEVTYRLQNSPYRNTVGHERRSIKNNPTRISGGEFRVLVQFPRFYGLVHEPVVLDFFYSRQFDRARSLMGMFLPSLSSEKATDFPVRWYLLLGFIHFRQDELKPAAQVCRFMETLPEGRSAWSLGVRMLSIFISIEQGASDLAEHQVERLRKYMERHQRIKPFSKREQLILRLLSCLVRSDFDFKRVITNYTEEVELLTSETGAYAWQHGGYELYPFQVWLQVKADGVSKD